MTSMLALADTSKITALLCTINDRRRKNPMIKATAITQHATRLLYAMELWEYDIQFGEASSAPRRELRNELTEAVHISLRQWLHAKSSLEPPHTQKSLFDGWGSRSTGIDDDPDCFLVGDPWEACEDLAAEDIMQWLAEFHWDDLPKNDDTSTKKSGARCSFGTSSTCSTMDGADGSPKASISADWFSDHSDCGSSVGGSDYSDCRNSLLSEGEGDDRPHDDHGRLPLFGTRLLSVVSIDEGGPVASQPTKPQKAACGKATHSGRIPRLLPLTPIDEIGPL
jgi:hypothetical protein